MLQVNSKVNLINLLLLEKKLENVEKILKLVLFKKASNALSGFRQTDADGNIINAKPLFETKRQVAMNLNVTLETKYVLNDKTKNIDMRLKENR